MAPLIIPAITLIHLVRLLRAAKEAQTRNSEQYKTLIDSVRRDHIEAAEAHIKSPDIIHKLRNDIEDECSNIIRTLEAVEELGEVSPKPRDRVMSIGEKLACRYMTAVLQDQGVDAEYVDLSEVVGFPAKSGLDQQFYDQVAAAFSEELQRCTAAVPVVTGYFGSITGGLLGTVGRGYTDLCAALVAVGIHAKELQVWKEVDGIFTADPRKVPTARLLSQISPAEASELTFYGSEVIHPFTMEQVMRAHIPIRIKNVMNPRGAGTIIIPDAATVGEAANALLSAPTMFRSRSSLHLGERKQPKRPTAVTVKHKILVINIHSNRRSLSHGFYFKIFSILHKWRMSVDLISTSEVHVSMAIHSEAPLYDGGGDDEYHIIDQDFQGAIEELKDYGKVDIIPEMAIVSLVGKDMANMVGIAGKMFSTLGENNVNIEMISQGKACLICPIWQC